MHLKSGAYLKASTISSAEYHYVKDKKEMLSDNIKRLRKSQGLSQEALAIELNVVRQTVSKWEKGISVPDSEMLLSLAHALSTDAATLLGESQPDEKNDEIRELSERLRDVSEKLTEQRSIRIRIVSVFLILTISASVLAALFLIASGSPYLDWNYEDPELAVFGVAWHSVEWVLVRILPAVILLSISGLIIVKRIK